jgi:hypothetical protein
VSEMVNTVEGTVLYVQEGRFELEDDAGVSQLFILSHRASLEPQQLLALQRGQARVRVRYENGEKSMSAIAHTVEAADDAVALAAERV